MFASKQHYSSSLVAYYEMQRCGRTLTDKAHESLTIVLCRHQSARYWLGQMS